MIEHRCLSGRDTLYGLFRFDDGDPTILVNPDSARF
jgi:hypothetical protein